ncbi:RTA1-domain-containing protein [Trametes coccinea BRFM310]|uniref:RTA1-domain-containing protein n=1 Tax=Trametes coccinea (strain BRFM310) TaxID=1353009 RepID=A0A1Y2IT74_TRAC3|nr:RTA1-domain-containing protein [Trametes coccinea BRFM310]
MALVNGTVSPTQAADQQNFYGYVPNRDVCFIFVVLFSVSAAIHLFEAIYWRMSWLYATACFAGVSEIVGWSARLWSSYSPLSQDPYIMQLCVTIIAPSPLVAALFILFGRISERLGAHYGRLTPLWYSIIFLTCDIISLVTQGVGGGIAGSSINNQSDVDLGGNIMLAGIIFQLASITVFVILMMEYLTRYFLDKPVRKSHKDSASVESRTAARGVLTRKLQLLVLGLLMMTMFLVIRSVYRMIELIDGFDGEIIRTEIWFNIFDGAMVVCAIYTLNVLHPGWLLERVYQEAPSVRLEDITPSGSPEPSFAPLDPKAALVSETW